MRVQCFPPGYHFNPTDDELVVDYLKKKMMNEPIPYNIIPEVNIYEYNPQQLSEKFPPVEENVWYFFTPRDRKFQNCARVNRVAGTGNWKATAKDKPVRYNGEIVGSKKMDDWVLCRIYNRDDKSLRNQHRGVPIENPCVPLQVEFPLENPQSMDYIYNIDQFNNKNNNNYIDEPSSHPQSINYMSQSNGVINNINHQDQEDDIDEANDNIVTAPNYDPSSGFEDFCMDLEAMLSTSNDIDIDIVEEEEEVAATADDIVDIVEEEEEEEEEVALVDNLHLNVGFDDFCKRLDNSDADATGLEDFCINFVNNLN
ncbi:hypothetical protein RD792_012615 [Penstemon davidsonii]|uniref:NAC domain-containing protein n=1 Tax=Penstemon davidsonii TaxID=160366 RepID=A0ABR0CYR2_9LAMI|nr:hypothetical protein RD792_012615 [Penstemon davidsonii]